MSNYTETAVANVPKAYVDNQKEDSGFVEFIVKQLSSELAERIMGILDREEEIIVGQSDLRVREFMPTNSVEYRRQIHWDSLVRCKDCIHRFKDGENVVFNCCELNHNIAQADDWFCADGVRREDGTND